MATEPQILPRPEPLLFIDECLPQLMAGEYTISADLSVTVAGAGKPDFETATKKVWVGAPRFTLDTTDVYSQYPPKDSSGRFENTLPHMVFNRRTLPWERTIDGLAHPTSAFRFANPARHAPWMALLLFSEEEMAGNGIPENAIIPDKRKLNETGSTVYMPEIVTWAPWEEQEAAYDTIDVPLPLFQQVAPLRSDLPYLAHVRKVVVDDSKESADIADDGYFATVMGNRLPVRAADKTSAVINSVFLVSLEGYQHYYSADWSEQSKGKEKVRLVVLQTWSFTVAPGKNFAELCEGLQVSPFKMNYPAGTDQRLAAAYDYGYTLLPHTTRNGQQTYSWYRGPFNPNFLPASPQTRRFATADAALRFDTATGLTDVSYAAAWQLGRLLALKNKTFSTALYQWKLQGKRQVVQAAGQQQISKLLPETATFRATPTASPEDTLKAFLGANYDTRSRFVFRPATFSNNAGEVQQRLNTLAEEDSNLPAVPDAVTSWLGKLFLLEGVPVNYLIPHDHYLVGREGESIVNEAIGTFYVDYDWLEALLGGALSIVATDDSVALLNRVKDGAFLPENLVTNKQNAAYVPVEEGQAVPLPEKITGHITGYFLRSQLVSGWKGIKVFARDESGGWMQHPLKIERVADDIQLCVFAGKLQQLVLIQPPEGIHFGLEANGDTWQKALRDQEGNVTQTTISLQTTYNRLPMQQMADSITEAGTPVNTSATLAFQLLESPVSYQLTIMDEWNKDIIKA